MSRPLMCQSGHTHTQTYTHPTHTHSTNTHTPTTQTHIHTEHTDICAKKGKRNQKCPSPREKKTRQRKRGTHRPKFLVPSSTFFLQKKNFLGKFFLCYFLNSSSSLCVRLCLCVGKPKKNLSWKGFQKKTCARLRRFLLGGIPAVSFGFVFFSRNISSGFFWADTRTPPPTYLFFLDNRKRKKRKRNKERVSFLKLLRAASFKSFLSPFQPEKRVCEFFTCFFDC